MPSVLADDVRTHLANGVRADGPGIVAGCPSEAAGASGQLDVEEPSAGSLQALHEAWNIETAWEPQQQMDVVGDHAHCKEGGAMSASLRGEKPIEEPSYGIVDHW